MEFFLKVSSAYNDVNIHAFQTSDLKWCLLMILMAKFGDCIPCWKAVIAFDHITLSWERHSYPWKKFELNMCLRLSVLSEFGDPWSFGESKF